MTTRRSGVWRQWLKTCVASDPDTSVPPSELSQAFRLSNRQRSCLSLRPSRRFLRLLTTFPTISLSDGVFVISSHVSILNSDIGATIMSSSNNSNTKMKGEVEAIGAHCQMEYCNVLDFLPFPCESCKG